MQASDGKLYGMTPESTGGGGVIFSFDPSTSTYTKLKDFNAGDGSNPYGSLMQASDGKLYGMTYAGGNNNYGVIFSYDLLTSTFEKLMDFDLANGVHPYGSLMQATDGKLYGMTTEGGNNPENQYSIGAGVLFSFDPSSATYTKLLDLGGGYGGHPFGSLMQADDGKLYGMTSSGGSSGGGSIFSFDPSSSTYIDLIDYGGSGNLIQGSDGKLYGMSNGRGLGVIFSFDPSSSQYTELKDFGETDGVLPHGSLMQASDGKLYGMTSQGGNSPQCGMNLASVLFFPLILPHPVILC